MTLNFHLYYKFYNTEVNNFGPEKYFKFITNRYTIYDISYAVKILINHFHLRLYYFNSDASRWYIAPILILFELDINIVDTNKKEMYMVTLVTLRQFKHNWNNSHRDALTLSQCYLSNLNIASTSDTCGILTF